MTHEKVLEVTASYKRILTDMGVKDPVVESDDILSHCFWMLSRIEDFVLKGKIGKAFRWLGFVQGCLWSTGARSIDEMRSDNRSVE